MKLLLLGGIAIILALVLMVFKFISIESETIKDLILIGNYGVVGLSLYVAYNYIKQINIKNSADESTHERFGDIERNRNRIPFTFELLFIVGILAMFWYGTVGFHTQIFDHISDWNKQAKAHTKADSKIAFVDDDELIKIGKKIYFVQCVSCHGRDGKGMDGKAQNHTARISYESVLDSIENGAYNFHSNYPSGMPLGILKGAEAKEVGKYVAQGMVGKRPIGWSACASCHGENGAGISFVAPDLKNYSDDFVAMVLSNGKVGAIGTMPNFNGRFSKNQIKAVAHYIRSLGIE